MDENGLGSTDSEYNPDLLPTDMDPLTSLGGSSHIPDEAMLFANQYN